MIVNMTTIASRQKHYIDATLESLLQSDGRNLRVNLILGSEDISHVERYAGVATIVPWHDRLEPLAKEGNLRRNCTVNAIRALRYGADEHCLCCEDDIAFKPDWLRQLRLTIEQIEARDYVLNLAQGRDPSPDKRYSLHTGKSLCGAQAIFYPSKSLRDRLALYVEENIGRSTNDVLIGRWAKQFAALYNTTPTLAWHIGQVSTFSCPAAAEPTPP